MKTQKDTFISDIAKTMNLIDSKTLTEIKEKTKFYKDSIDATKGLITAIKANATGSVVESEIERARARVEVINLESKLKVQQRYSDHWKDRSMSYSGAFSKITKECNDNFDTIMKVAKENKTKHVDILTHLGHWESNTDQKDQTLKNQHYLILKKDLFVLGILNFKTK